ncbi:hypothetical protein D3C80_1048880 [compost metagenome]
MLLRNVQGTQNSLHIIDGIETKSLPVFVQSLVLAKSIILIILTIMRCPEHDLIRLEFAEAIGTYNIIK